MIRWTGLAPWEFEFPFAGSLTSDLGRCGGGSRASASTSSLTSSSGLPLSPSSSSSSTLVTGPRRSLSLELSDTRVYEPQIRARLGTTPVCLSLLLKLRCFLCCYFLSSSSSLLISSLELSDTQSLCALTTSPSRNRFTFL